MRQSKSDFAARKAQNKGVRHGATRMGKGGKTMRRYNAKTARWEAVGSARAGMPKRTSQNPKGTMLAQYSAYAAPKSSWGSAWTSTGGAGSPNRAMRRPGTPRTSLFGSKRPKGPRTSKTIVSLRTGRS